MTHWHPMATTYRAHDTFNLVFNITFAFVRLIKCNKKPFYCWFVWQHATEYVMCLTTNAFNLEFRNLPFSLPTASRIRNFTASNQQYLPEITSDGGKGRNRGRPPRFPEVLRCLELSLRRKKGTINSPLRECRRHRIKIRQVLIGRRINMCGGFQRSHCSKSACHRAPRRPRPALSERALFVAVAADLLLEGNLKKMLVPREVTVNNIIIKQL